MKAETERLTFDQIREKVESYPAPIAAAFKRYSHAAPGDLAGRYWQLIDLFEVFVKILCAIQIKEGQESVPNFTDRLPAKWKTLDFLGKSPSPGKWVGLLRVLSETDLANSKPRWFPEIAAWYQLPRDSSNEWVAHVLKEIKDLNLSLKDSAPPNALICEALTNSRNKRAHQPSLPADEAQALLTALEPVVAYLLDSASFLAEMQLLVTTNRAELTEDENWLTSTLALNGAAQEDLKYLSKKLLKPHFVYLTTRNGGPLQRPALELAPFLVWQPGPDLKKGEIYVLNEVAGQALKFVSYNGAAPFSETNKQLRNSFDDLMSLDYHPADIDAGQYKHRSTEERFEIAQDLYNSALNLIDHEYFEEALESLREATRALRRPEILVTTAEVMLRLKEAPEDIKELLNQARDLDPKNAEAQALLTALAGGEHHASELHTYAPLRRTAFHFFCPPFLRNHALTFWSTLILGWYSISALVEFKTGDPERSVATALVMLCCLAVVFGAAMLRPWAERLRKPLRQQLSAMKEGRFNDWFDEQLRMMFESFATLSSKPSGKRNKRILYALGFLWMLSMVGGALFFSQAYNAPPLMMIKRLVDYFLLFAILYPAAQYTCAITLFVYRFSNLSLKPILTKTSNDGVRNLGPFVAFSIVFGTLIFSVLHVSFAIGFTNPMRIDLLFLLVGTGITAMWTIAFPFQLRRSLKASKNIAMWEYSGHLQKAFKKFLKDPSESNEKDYRRLADNEKIIRKISVWPLSATETIFTIVGGNLLLAVVATGYVIHRLGLWEKLWSLF
jgi:hypothetical protein